MHYRDSQRSRGHSRAAPTHQYGRATRQIKAGALGDRDRRWRASLLHGLQPTQPSVRVLVILFNSDVADGAVRNLHNYMHAQLCACEVHDGRQLFSFARPLIQQRDIRDLSIRDGIRVVKVIFCPLLLQLRYGSCAKLCMVSRINAAASQDCAK